MPLRCPVCSTHTPRSPYTGASPRPFSAVQRGGSGTGAADAAAADAYRQESYFAELLGYRCTGARVMFFHENVVIPASACTSLTKTIAEV